MKRTLNGRRASVIRKVGWLSVASMLALALLAALAIFVWHFYNVHLRPAIFPMPAFAARLDAEHLYARVFEKRVEQADRV